MKRYHALLATFSAFVLVAVLAPVAYAGQPRFYLSTERVYSPSEKDIHVRLEARNLPHIDFRLYRVPDPAKFFSEQDNLHRVEMANAPIRANSFDVAQELWRGTLENTLEQVRDRFSDKARSVGRDAYAEEVESIRSAVDYTPQATSVVPLLKGFTLVDYWREDIPKDSPEWAYVDVDITPRDPGVYLIEGVYGHEVGYTMVIISKVVLLTRQSPDRFLVYAVDPDLGTPVSDVSVSLNDGDQKIGQGETNDKGIWSKRIPLTRKLTVYASKGRNFTLADPSYHPASLFSRKVYLTTERPVYRPGQSVFYKGLVRSYVDEDYKVDSDLKQAAISIRDPNGHEVFTAKVKIHDGSSFDGKFDLFKNAAMGTYQLLAEVGDKEYGGEFKVKAYRKPEYKVKVSTIKRAFVSGEKVAVTVSANYYFGPPVPKAKVKISVYRTRFYIPWWVDADYSWYYSDAEYQSTMRETILEKEGRLDDKGEFKFDFKTLPESWDYTYGVEAIVTDAANQAVSGYGSVRVTQARFRIALEPELLLFSPGQEARVNLVTTDYDKNPIAVEVDVVVTAKVGSQPSKATTKEFLAKKISTGKKGQAMISFKPEKGGTYMVTARAKDKQGHQIEQETLVYVTSSGGDIPYAPEELEIVADRRSYKVGDKARFLILVPHADAHMLVTVEGGRLYSDQVIRAKGYSAVFETPIKEAQTPNFLIRVATIFDRTLYERRLDVVVPPRQKLLAVKVSTDKEKVRPGEKVTFKIEVKDYEGEPVSGAEVALGVVDEAIYGISPEIAVPISQFFYHRKRNNVRAVCSLDFRFYGYGEESKDRMAALNLRQPVVPGSFKAMASMDVRKKFKDTLEWFPRLKTNSKGIATATVTVPDNLTAWRGFARVITDETEVGQGRGKVKVSKPVVLRIAAPAFLVERDETTIGVLVHNYTESVKDFKVALEIKGKQLELIGKPDPLKVLPGGLGIATWKVNSLIPGTATLRASAKAGSVGDAVERQIPILPYGMEQILLASGVLDNDRPEASFELTVPQSAKPGSPQAQVTVSTGVAPALLASLDYLTGYPYGCTEQTMSRFLPDLVVARALKDLGMKSKRLEEKLPEYIHAGIAHLGQLQHEDGGWGWWTNDPTDPFMTAYVVHGLAMAKRLNWPVNKDMLNRGANRLKALARRSSLSPNQRSYMLYSLALAGIKYESMLASLTKETKLSEYGKALLAMALFEMGKKEAAQALTAQIDMVVKKGRGGAYWGNQAAGPGWENDPIETTAVVLRSLLQINPESVNIGSAVRYLMSAREGNHWQSTRDTAMVVYALVDYLKKAGSKEYDSTVSVTLNGKQLKPHKFGKDDIFKPSVALVNQAEAKIGANQIKLSRSGKGDLFCNASVKYFGREDQIRARGDKFRIKRRMFALKKELRGNAWRFTTKPLLGTVKPGDEILVVLDIEASQDTDYVMIEDPLAAGVQPITRDQGYSVPGYRLQQPRMHREFFEQHAAFFISNLRRGKRSLAYLVRAALPGSYNVMPARVLPMYHPQFAGNSASQRIKIED
ncbi:MAG: hypothetical protein JRJ87_12695 [Deltaproteobacteria bacterium]|nr:hypothetical protein [Deltaproteobacteria bacterium]